jgi:hypothetical protein
MEDFIMKNISTGTGLALLAGSLLASTAILRVGTGDQVAHAVMPEPAAAQAGPTVVWMGVTDYNWPFFEYHRLWSDGRLEVRSVVRYNQGSECAARPWFTCPNSSDWIEVPPPPAGNGFACRSDLNGDRTVDGADLSFILANWGPQQPCEPEATYPCLSIPGGSLVQ